MVLFGADRFFPIWIPRQGNFDQRNNIAAGVWETQNRILHFLCPLLFCGLVQGTNNPINKSVS